MKKEKKDCGKNEDMESGIAEGWNVGVMEYWVNGTKWSLLFHRYDAKTTGRK